MSILRNNAVQGVSYAVLLGSLGCVSAEEGGAIGNGSIPPPVISADVAQEVERQTRNANPAMSVDALLEEMDYFGPGAEARVDRAVSEFLASDHAFAVLQQHYRQTALENFDVRWKIVFLLGQLPGPASLGFLEQEALATPVAIVPEDNQPVDPDRHAHTSTGDGYDVRLRAALGVVNNCAVSVDGADAAVDRLLANADSGIAQVMAMELANKVLLTNARRRLLADRGISTAFRRLSEAEALSVRTINPQEMIRPEETASDSQAATLPPAFPGDQP